MNLSEYFSRDYSGVALPRTKRMMPFNFETAFNTGSIIPVLSEEIYPGDQWKTKVAYLLRSFTPLKQLFSNIFLDFHAFFVPNRLVWTHWANFCGQNDTTAWTETGNYTVPVSSMGAFTADHSKGEDLTDAYLYFCGSLGDYLGINPTIISHYDPDGDPNDGGNVDGFAFPQVNDLFRRAYILCYDEWYRDQNVEAPILFSKGDYEGMPVYTYSDQPLKAAKFHDYFTSLLPAPMKGTPPVIGKDLPVVPGDEHIASGDKVGSTFLRVRDGTTNVVGNKLGQSLIMADSNGGLVYTSSGTTPSNGAVISNLWATMTITIEDIRNAAVATHILEKMATSGTRYPEFLKGIWGVTSSNAELQIPELLGALRFPVTVQEVVSNADTSGSSGEILGATGAMIKSGNAGHLFNKAFTEYGILYVFAVVRVEQCYFQGLHRKWMRRNFFDFYNPLFQGIGNQPVFKYELLSVKSHDITDDPDTPSDSVLGYSEAFAELRHIPNRISSIMRPDVPLGLASWNASEVYDDQDGVSLNSDFIHQQPTGFDRVLAVPSSTRGSFQWFGEFHFSNEVTRIITDHAIPGMDRI